MSIYPLSAANTRRSTDAELLLAQRLRRWTNINQASVQIIPTAVSAALLVVIIMMCDIHVSGLRCTISG